MAIPNGVTPDGSQSAKQDDISKLTDLLINIDKSLSTLSGISTDEEKRGKQARAMQVSKNPTVSDLIKFTNNLGLAVPAGFILIHNDLQKLISSDTGGGSMWDALGKAISTSIIGAVAALMAGGVNLVKAGGEAVATGAKGVGEAASGVVNSVSSGAVDIITALKKTGDASIDLLLADEEFANSLKKNTDISTFRTMAVKTYLKAYYANMIEPTGYSVNVNDGVWELTRSGSWASFLDGISQAGSSFLTSTFEGFGRAISNIVADASLNSNKDVEKVRTMGYTSYLRAYYANMINPLGYVVDSETGGGINGDNWTLKEQLTFSSAGKAFGNFIGGIISGPIQQVGDAVTNTIADIPTSFNDTVEAVRVMGYSNYLKAYYANMINPMGYTVDDINAENWTMTEKTTFSSAGKAFGNFIGGIVSGPIQMIGDSLTNTVADIPTSFSKKAEDARVLGYSSYLRAYYANMIFPMGYTVEDVNANEWKLVEKVTASSVGKAIGNFVGGLVTGPMDAISGSLTNTIANVVESFKPEVDEVRAHGYIAYLKAYYANMVKPLGLEVPVDSLNNNTWTLYKPEKASAEAIIKIITDGIGRLAASPIEGIMRSISDLAMDASANKDEEVQKTRKAGYRAYVRAYYLDMLESYGYTVDLDNLNKDQFTIKKGGWGTGLLQGIWSDLTSNAGKGLGNVIGGALTNISNHIFDDSLDSDPKVLSTKAAGFSSLLSVYYDKMAEAIDDVNGNWGSDLRSYAKDALKNAFNALGETTSNQIKNNTTIISSTYDDSWVLDAIYGLRKVVEGVTAKLDTIIEKEPVVVNTNNGQNLPSTVNYGELAE